MISQLITPRTASMRLRLPWTEIRDEIERSGGRVVRIGGRERVLESDIVALLDRGAQPTAAEAAVRTELALQQALEDMGLRPKRGRRPARAPARRREERDAT